MALVCVHCTKLAAGETMQNLKSQEWDAIRTGKIFSSSL